MSITVTITAASVSELHHTMREMMGYDHPAQPGAPISQEKVSQVLSSVGKTSESVHNYAGVEEGKSANVTLPPNVEVAPTKEEKPKRTRKPKEEKPAPEYQAPEAFETKQHDTKAEEPVTQPPAGAQAADTGAPTKEKVHQALQQVNVAVNLTKAREILAKFNVQRISEIQPPQYQAFIDACNEAVAMS